MEQVPSHTWSYILRIIGGFLKKKQLCSVSGDSTRPTSDRLRESIFNILSYYVRESTVLDLFAGTGALGIESLSRGASTCVFIDNQSQAVSVIRKNIKNCSLENKANVYKWDITRNLNCIKKTTTPFNLVFIDPPYSKGMMNNTLENLENTNTLDEGARIVMEHDSSDTIQTLSPRFKITDCRTYGRTSVSFLIYSK